MTRPRRRRAQIPPPSPPPITLNEAHDLATRLVAELAAHAGDPEEVRAVLRAWLDTEDAGRLALIALVVVRDVFSDYLTRVPSHEVPPGALVLTEGTPT